MRHYSDKHQLLGSIWTQLEQQRQSKWQTTVSNVGLLPVGWFSKVRLLQSTMSQLTYGQGMHILHLNQDKKRALRACVIRTLLNQTFYDASPTLHQSAFALFKRMYDTPASRQQLCEKVTDTQYKIKFDNPIARL